MEQPQQPTGLGIRGRRQFGFRALHQAALKVFHDQQVGAGIGVEQAACPSALHQRAGIGPMGHQLAAEVVVIRSPGLDDELPGGRLNVENLRVHETPGQIGNELRGTQPRRDQRGLFGAQQPAVPPAVTLPCPR